MVNTIETRKSLNPFQSDESPERPTEENQPNWVLSKESSGSKPSSIVTQGSSGSNSSAESQSTITSDNRVYSTTDVFTKEPIFSSSIPCIHDNMQKNVSYAY